jgi:hypothetical protein
VAWRGVAAAVAVAVADGVRGEASAGRATSRAPAGSGCTRASNAVLVEPLQRGAVGKWEHGGVSGWWWGLGESCDF